MMKKCWIVAAAIVACLTGPIAASEGAAADPGGALAALPRLKDFVAGRESSHDRTGGNQDGQQANPILPGEVRELARIDGPGAITHIWMTISSHDRVHLRNLVLRMYWDGEEGPSVEVPVGDFFGLGHARYYQYACLPIQIGTNRGLNCFWRMPFAKGARIAVTNEGPKSTGALYYYIDYVRYPSPPPDVGRFHAQYRQAFPCQPGENYTILEARGQGHYVGCNLSIVLNADGWWGEGDDMIYVDGEDTPSLYGTGSEDYFCGAWCYGSAFSDLYFGCPLRGEHKSGALWNVYRYHVADPIPFTKSMLVTIEHGHANDRSDNFASVAYWYQTEPHAPLSPLPDADARIPEQLSFYIEPGATEAELALTLFPDTPLAVKQVGDVAGDRWSDAHHLLFEATGPRSYICSVTLEARYAGAYTVEGFYTAGPDYGRCEVWLNGTKACEWDGYHEDQLARRKITFDTTVTAGELTFELRITGKNAASEGYLAGVDCLSVKPAG